jgi:hypothetical protein
MVAPPAPPPPAVNPVLPTPELSGGERNFTFASGSGEYSFAVPVVPAYAPGDPRFQDCPLMAWRPGEEEQLASYYAGIFRDPREDQLFDPLLSEFRHIRRTGHLNSDEYLELLTNFVQEIPYDPRAPVCPRRPDQVILDGKGDCDEKSLLLLGLLYREGYNAAILLFPDRHHATAGIGIEITTQPSFRVYGTGGQKYVYIETTHPSLIGLYPDDFANATPIVVPTGNGTVTYQAINDVMRIVSTQKRMEEKMRWINGTATGMLGEIDALEGKLSAGTGYANQEEYDADYTRYTSLVAQYNNYVDQFGEIHEVYVYILEHQYDRQGVRDRIANSKVENLL